MDQARGLYKHKCIASTCPLFWLWRLGEAFGAERAAFFEATAVGCNSTSHFRFLQERSTIFVSIHININCWLLTNLLFRDFLIDHSKKSFVMCNVRSNWTTYSERSFSHSYLLAEDARSTEVA